jgi:hypothetical protein
VAKEEENEDDEALKQTLEASELAGLAQWPDLPLTLHASIVEGPVPMLAPCRRRSRGHYMLVGRTWTWTSMFPCTHEPEEERHEEQQNAPAILPHEKQTVDP